MEISAIARVDLGKMDLGLLEAREHLEAKAAKLFGAKVGYEDRVTQPFGSITKALKQMGVNPLDYFDVQKYKSSKEKQYVEVRTWVCLGWVAAGVALFVDMCLRASNVETGAFWAHMVPAFICGIISLSSWNSMDKVVKRWKWESYSLNSFKYPVPDYAMSKAVQLAEMVPGVRFDVEALELITVRTSSNWEQARQARRDSDPFLVARMGNEVVYLDVWDEADFKIR